MTENPEQQTGPPTRFLRMSEVQARTSLSRSTIRRWVDRRLFSQPIALGERVVGWVEAEIEGALFGDYKENLTDRIQDDVMIT